MNYDIYSLLPIYHCHWGDPELSRDPHISTEAREIVESAKIRFDLLLKELDMCILSMTKVVVSHLRKFWSERSLLHCRGA